ncbi:hypothetical protein TB2_038154 [Malus domestica]
MQPLLPQFLRLHFHFLHHHLYNRHLVASLITTTEIAPFVFCLFEKGMLIKRGTTTARATSVIHPRLGITGTPRRRGLRHLRSSGLEGKIKGMMAAKGVPKEDLDLGIERSGRRIGMNVGVVVVVSAEREWAGRLRSYSDGKAEIV